MILVIILQVGGHSAKDLTGFTKTRGDLHTLNQNRPDRFWRCRNLSGLVLENFVRPPEIQWVMDLVVEIAKDFAHGFKKFFKAVGGKAFHTSRFSFSEYQKTVFQHYGCEREQRKPMS